MLSWWGSRCWTSTKAIPGLTGSALSTPCRPPGPRRRRRYRPPETEVWRLRQRISLQLPAGFLGGRLKLSLAASPFSSFRSFAAKSSLATSGVCCQAAEHRLVVAVGQKADPGISSSSWNRHNFPSKYKVRCGILIQPRARAMSGARLKQACFWHDLFFAVQDVKERAPAG